MSRADDALRWLDARHLKLRGLDRRTRWAVIVGLVTAAIAAVVMIITSLGGPTLANKPCQLSRAGLRQAIGAAGVAVGSSALGLVLIAGSGAVAPWRLPRTRFVAVLLIPLLLALVALITFPVTGSGWAFVTKSHIRAVWPFLALMVLLMIMVATRLRGFRSATATALTVLVGFAGFVGYVLGTWASLGACPAALVTGDSLALIGFFAMVGIPVLLIWLGVEGLRLSSTIGAHALGMVLRAKVAVSPAGRQGGGHRHRGVADHAAPGAATGSPCCLQADWRLGIAVVVVLLIMTLLTREERLIGSGPDDFTIVSRGFALLVAMTLVTIPAYGVIGMLSALPGRPALALALIVTVVVAVLAGLLLRRRSPLAAVVVIVVAAVSSYALLLWSYAHSGQFQLAAPVRLRRHAATVGSAARHSARAGPARGGAAAPPPPVPRASGLLRRPAGLGAGHDRPAAAGGEPSGHERDRRGRGGHRSHPGAGDHRSARLAAGGQRVRAGAAADHHHRRGGGPGAHLGPAAELEHARC